MKHTNICLEGVKEGQEAEKGAENILKEEQLKNSLI